MDHTICPGLAAVSGVQKGPGHLAREPALRGIRSDFEMNNPPAVEAEHNQSVQEPERRGGNHKNVDHAMSGWWLRRKVRQVGEGTLGR